MLVQRSRVSLILYASIPPFEWLGQLEQQVDSASLYLQLGSLSESGRHEHLYLPSWRMMEVPNHRCYFSGHLLHPCCPVDASADWLV